MQALSPSMDYQQSCDACHMLLLGLSVCPVFDQRMPAGENESSMCAAEQRVF